VQTLIQLAFEMMIMMTSLMDEPASQNWRHHSLRQSSDRFTCTKQSVGKKARWPYAPETKKERKKSLQNGNSSQNRNRDRKTKVHVIESWSETGLKLF